jgi:ABC-type cobalamin/Fe3+-siderophores transport system ATPase subunit
MDTDDLVAALRACAAGLYPLEAGTELLISNATFLHRDDFASRFITYGTSDGTPMAAIDWDAAITALASGGLLCSGGERRVLHLSASLAAGTPVRLRDTVTGLDHDNTVRLLAAIQHATGKRSETAIAARLVMAKSSHSTGG